MRALRAVSRRVTGLACCWVVLIVLTVLAPATARAQTFPWSDPSLPAQHRAQLVLNAMSQDQKISFITDPTVGIPAFDVPGTKGIDGCCGVSTTAQATTQMPSGTSLASSFDPGLAGLQGHVLGHEAWLLGWDYIDAPNLDLARVPESGRLWEALGEDPFLAGRLGAGVTAGIQSGGDGVYSMPKHYNVYNQETGRQLINEIVSRRAIQELYTIPWAYTIDKAHPGAVMCGFPQINGAYDCQNSYLLTDVLKYELGFRGYVWSDFDALVGVNNPAPAGEQGPQAIAAGADSGTPSSALGTNLADAVASGQVPEARLNDAVLRILRTLFADHVYDNPPPQYSNQASSPLPADVTTADDAAALKVEQRGIVLLRNADQLLPLSRRRVSSIAVIGGDADWNIQGAGASHVPVPTHLTTMLNGIRQAAGSGTSVNWAPGYDPLDLPDTLSGPPPVPSSVLRSPSGAPGLQGQYYLGTTFSGSPLLTRTDLEAALRTGVGDFVGFGLDASQRPPLPNDGPLLYAPISVRWTGTLTAPATGTYQLALSHLGTARLYLDGKLLIDNPGTDYGTQTVSVPLTAGQSHSVEIDYATDNPNQFAGGIGTEPGPQLRFGWTMPAGVLNPAQQQAVALAKRSDVAVVVARDYRGEDADVGNLTLPQDQDRLIEAVRAVNPRTIVVAATGGPTLMPWIDNVKGVLEAWYGGQEQGLAVGRVLFGDVDPSGRLPVSFPRTQQAQPIHTQAQWPGLPSGTSPTPTGYYSEGLGVGYRGYDELGIAPLFPFGYGLSYTKFAYSRLRVGPFLQTGTAPVRVTFDVTNTGSTAGTVTPQVYLGLPRSTGEPPKRLVGFAHVSLAPGETRRVQITIHPAAASHPLAYFDTAADAWRTARGPYLAYVGDNERQTPLVRPFLVTRGG